MKLPPSRIEAVLSAPGAELRGVLLFGPDSGLVRERAARLVQAVAGDPSDPFRVAEASGAALVADPARLADEAQALSLTGGRRVFWLREAGDALGELFAGFFHAALPGETLVVVEAGDLATRSSLRRAFETAARAAAIGCYADGERELATLTRQVMAQHQITIAEEALAYLVEHLGGDRLLSRQELEKLALYVGDGGRLDLAAAEAMVGDSAELTLEDAVYAAADGLAAD